MRCVSNQNQRQNGKHWPEEGHLDYCLIGTELQFYKMSMVMAMGGRDGYINIRNIFNATEVCLKMVKVVNFMFCVFYNTFKKLGEKVARDKVLVGSMDGGLPRWEQAPALPTLPRRDRGTITQQLWHQP